MKQDIDAIILSIHPKYVKNILNATKTYELRKSFPKNKINKILIYETAPTSKVVAEIEVEQQVFNKKDFYKKYKENIGVSKEEYDKYYKNKEEVKVYKINKVINYDFHKDIKEYGYKLAPQNFYYLK